MDCNQWNNHTAIGYLKYALNFYNKKASEPDSRLRVLTQEEMNQIIGSMRYAFDMRTLEDAYDMA